MCGIFCDLSVGGHQSVCPIDELKRRGPGSFSETTTRTCLCNLTLSASVLHMRGAQLQMQPIVAANGDSLLFNGEIYEGLELSHAENDALALLNALSACENPLEIIPVLRGEFCFVFYQKERNRLWFGRDLFGRRSLVFACQKERLLICSVCARCDFDWHELPAGAIICLDIAEFTSAKPNLSAVLLRPTDTKLLEPFGNCFDLQIDERYQKNMDLFEMNSDLDNLSVWEGLDISCIPDRLSELADQFIDQLSCAVKRRLSPLPAFCRKCSESEDCPPSHTRAAVLFSGGVDSLLLSSLAHKNLDPGCPIDLLNVAFASGKNGSSFEVPDRTVGRQCYDLLRKIYPSRRWNFVCIDIGQDELAKMRKERICSLVRPCDTVLDDTIGCAMWFAARGEGVLDGDEYISPAKILLLGTGADELLGGYARHRTRYMQGGWSAVVQELEMEIARISVRNLGRDDRVIADHGRESRLPYLDEDFVRFCNSLPIFEKTNFDAKRGFGEKILLRVALSRLGLQAGAWTPKRAMQFGSRIAKMENSKEKADHKCSRLGPTL